MYVDDLYPRSSYVIATSDGLAYTAEAYSLSALVELIEGPSADVVTDRGHVWFNPLHVVSIRKLAQ